MPVSVSVWFGWYMNILIYPIWKGQLFSQNLTVNIPCAEIVSFTVQFDLTKRANSYRLICMAASYATWPRNKYQVTNICVRRSRQCVIDQWNDFRMYDNHILYNFKTSGCFLFKQNMFKIHMPSLRSPVL